MLFNAENGSVKIENTEIDYIAFGKGKTHLVMLPGLGDGLQNVKGMAVPFAFLYRKLVKDYRVHVISRRNHLPEGYTTRDMARDVHYVMEQLGIQNANLVGVSQGGMIAQYVAIDYPQAVHKLILAVTLSRQNAVLQQVVRSWMEMAKQKDYKGIMMDTAEKSYTEKRLRIVRKMYSLMGRMNEPKSYERFLIMADACLTHDAHAEIHKISCPTLILGGLEDAIVTGKASEDIAEQIKGSRLYMYGGLGHGLYEEAPDFVERIVNFVKEH